MGRGHVACAQEHAPVAAGACRYRGIRATQDTRDRKSTRLNSSHANISYAVFCLQKKNHTSQVLSSRYTVWMILIDKNHMAPYNHTERRTARDGMQSDVVARVLSQETQYVSQSES